MENNIITDLSERKPNYRLFTEENDKPFYAAYLNTAKQNVFIVLRDISEKLELGFNLDDDSQMFGTSLWQKLKSSDQPEITQKIVTRLEEQFSFLNNLATGYARNRANSNKAEPVPEDYYEVLKIWIEQLLEYRNYYSHAVHNPVQMSSTVIDGMRGLYDASQRKVKEVFSLNDEDVALLVRRGEKGLERPNFQYGFTENKGELSQNGFLFFVCQWLAKRDGQEFLKKHKWFKQGKTKADKATLDTYTHFAIKIPKPRLTNENTKQDLFLNMINELKRCPRELYYRLDEKDKMGFIPQPDEENRNDEDNQELQSPLIRNDNRFYYFALRYLDNTFSHLKFHIDLGNYCFNTYEQEIEGTPRKRRWFNRMTAFGNLVDFKDRPKAWTEKLLKPGDTDKPETYLTHTTPHYHFDPGSEVMNIGMKWVEEYNSRSIWPDIPDNEGVKPVNHAPDYWLSLYELPAVVFYQLLYQTQNESQRLFSAERIIGIHKGKVNKFLNDVANGVLKNTFTNESLKQELKKRDLKIHYIPSSITNYLLCKGKSYEVKARMRLEKFKAENEKMLSKVNRQQSHFHKKHGSKDYIPMKPGNMADFLARDMIQLQRPIEQEKGKPNSTEFQVLQAKLAFFGKNKVTLSETFKLCNLIESDNSHPFLHRIDVQKCNGILDFYINYLELRDTFLWQCLQDKNYEQCHFLRLGDEITDINKQIKKQQEAVMNLPRGLFEKPILEALKKLEGTKVLAEVLESKPRVNIAYIIQAYFKQVKKDDNQEFYNYSRSYDMLNEIFDDRTERDKKTGKRIKKWYFNTQELNDKSGEIKEMLKEKIEQKKKEKKKHADKERVQENYKKQYKQFTENEKQIRLFKTCDSVLFLMADQMYCQGDFLFDGQSRNQQKGILGIGEKYKLSTIKPNAEKSILSEETTVKLPVFYSEHEKTFKKVIVRNKMKIKNYGDFRGFLKDRRIIGMLPYIQDEEILYEAVNRELEEFHRARFVVFEAILEFEKAAIRKYSLQTNENGYITHKCILCKVKGLPVEKQEQMCKLRNAFCHSQYPEYGLFKDKINGREFNSLAQYSQENKEIREKAIIVQFEKLTINYYHEALELIK